MISGDLPSWPNKNKQMENYKNLKQSYKYYIQLLGPLLIFFLFLMLFSSLEEYSDGYASWVNGSPIVRLLTAGVPTALIVFLIQHWYSVNYGEKRLKRILALYQKKSLADCQSGETVIVSGAATITESALLAPYTNKECVGYKITARQEVEVSSRGSRSSMIWEDFATFSNYQNFILVSGDKYAYVITKEAELIRDEDIVFSKSEFEPFSGESEQKARLVLKKMGILLRSNFIGYGRGLRFIEARFDINENLMVCGEGTWQSVSDYPELDVLKGLGVSRVYVIQQAKDKPLIISDAVERLYEYFV